MVVGSSTIPLCSSIGRSHLTCVVGMRGRGVVLLGRVGGAFHPRLGLPQVFYVWDIQGLPPLWSDLTGFVGSVLYIFIGVDLELVYHASREKINRGRKYRLRSRHLSWPSSWHACISCSSAWIPVLVPFLSPAFC